MGAEQSISQATLDELKKVSEKLKSAKEVEELEEQVKALIKAAQDKIDKQGDAKPATATPSDAATATPTKPEATEPAAGAAQAGGKRLKKRRISNKKRVSHRLTRSLKLI